jgi:hypothetical protein
MAGFNVYLEQPECMSAITLQQTYRRQPPLTLCYKGGFKIFPGGRPGIFF